MTNRKGYTSDAPAYVNTPGVGAIWLIRDNDIVKDYADTRVTEADYGAGLQQALADAIPNDTIVCGPGTFRAADIRASVADVTTIFHDTKLGPSSANYDQLLWIEATALRNRVVGLTTFDDNPAVTGEGAGIRINAGQAKLSNCKGLSHKGTANTQGYGLWAIGPDCEINNYWGELNQYCAIRANDAERLRIIDNYLINNGTQNDINSRAIQIEGTQSIDSVRIQGTKTLATVAPASAQINVSTNGSIANLHISDCQVINKDQVASGVSFDNSVRMQCLKVQNIGSLYLADCEVRHGVNQGAGGYVTGLAFDEPCETVVIKGCTFSDGLQLLSTSNRAEFMDISENYFGRDQAELAPAHLFRWGCNGRHVAFRNNTFNCHSAFRVFDFPNEAPLAGDVLEMTGNTFLGSKPDSHQNIADDQPKPGTILQAQPRRMIVADNNFVQTGGFEFRASNWEGLNGTAELNLMMTTDRNGNMLFDENRVGLGAGQGMPDPGPGPTYFSANLKGYDGQQILNFRYSPGLTNVYDVRGWVYISGQWRDLGT